MAPTGAGACGSDSWARNLFPPRHSLPRRRVPAPSAAAGTRWGPVNSCSTKKGAERTWRRTRRYEKTQMEPPERHQMGHPDEEGERHREAHRPSQTGRSMRHGERRTATLGRRGVLPATLAPANTPALGPGLTQGEAAGTHRTSRTGHLQDVVPATPLSAPPPPGEGRLVHDGRSRREEAFGRGRPCSPVLSRPACTGLTGATSQHPQPSPPRRHEPPCSF